MMKKEILFTMFVVGFVVNGAFGMDKPERFKEFSCKEEKLIPGKPFVLVTDANPCLVFKRKLSSRDYKIGMYAIDMDYNTTLQPTTEHVLNWNGILCKFQNRNYAHRDFTVIIKDGISCNDLTYDIMVQMREKIEQERKKLNRERKELNREKK